MQAMINIHKRLFFKISKWSKYRHGLTNEEYKDNHVLQQEDTAITQGYIHHYCYIYVIWNKSNNFANNRYTTLKLAECIRSPTIQYTTTNFCKDMPMSSSLRYSKKNENGQYYNSKKVKIIKKPNQ